MKKKTATYIVIDEEGDISGLVKSSSKTYAWKKVAREHGISVGQAKDFLDLKRGKFY